MVSFSDLVEPPARVLVQFLDGESMLLSFSIAAGAAAV